MRTTQPRQDLGFEIHRGCAGTCLATTNNHAVICNLQGNIWSLMQLRHRYGDSVGGMLVPLTGGKYSIADNRLQGCVYFFLAGLLGTQVAPALEPSASFLPPMNEHYSAHTSGSPFCA